MSSGTIHAELVKEDPAAALLLDNPESAAKSIDIQKQHDFENRLFTSTTTVTTATTQDNADQDTSLDFFDADGASFWGVLASYSMLLLWIQGFALGIVTGLSSTIWSCLRLFVRDNSSSHNSNNSQTNNHTCRTTLVRGDHETIHHPYSPGGGPRSYFYLMQSLLLGGNSDDGPPNASVSSSIPHKQVNGPWPPPGLVVLATLTVVALVVHPDGMTWVMLKKIQDAMLSLLQSSTTCWDIMIRDYGMTVSASASIVLVLIVAIAMHKAFLPNCCGGGSKDNVMNGKRKPAEKKRRRRKGHSKNNHTKGRIKGGTTASNTTNPVLGLSRLPKVEEVASDGAGDISSRSSSSQSEDSETTQNVDENDDATDKPALESNTDVNNEEERTSDATMNAFSMEEETSIMTSPSVLESVVSSEEYEVKQGRTPVPSICTVDTTSISDDISCGSHSVRSGPHTTRLPVNNHSTASTPTNNKGNTKPNSSGTRGNRKVNQNPRGGQKQSKTAPMAKWTTNAPPMTPMSRAEGLKTAKPVPKHPMSSSAAPDSSPRNPDGHQKRTPGGKGRNSASQNPRGNRGKGGRATSKHQQPKHQTNAARTVSPVTTTLDNSFPLANTPSPTPRTTPAIASGSPPERNAECNHNDDISSLVTSNENNNQSRLPPFSPYSQSLFSCELGASDWSLPALPVVSKPKNVAGTLDATSSSSALSYSSNPFVTPYSQLPTEYNGLSSPVVPESNNASLGLWNSSTSVQDKSLGNLTTPQRSVRPPPGLSAPPGFAPAVQPTLTTPDFYSPTRLNNDTPPLMPATPSSVGTPMTAPESSPFSWNSSTPNDPATVGSSSSSPAMMIQSTPGVKKNPFASDTTAGGGHADEVDCRIEAEMQELGGRMIGSILDF